MLPRTPVHNEYITHAAQFIYMFACNSCTDYIAVRGPHTDRPVFVCEVGNERHTHDRDDGLWWWWGEMWVASARSEGNNTHTHRPLIYNVHVCTVRYVDDWM